MMMRKEFWNEFFKREVACHSHRQQKMTSDITIHSNPSSLINETNNKNSKQLL
jgi:ribosomal protein L35